MTSRSSASDEDVCHIYRLIAEGATEAAMDAFYSAFGISFGLRNPTDEKRLIANIARGRAKEASHAEN